MKTTLFLVFLFTSQTIWGQEKVPSSVGKEGNVSSHPCMDSIPPREDFIVCVDGETLHLLQFRASYLDHRLSLVGNKSSQHQMSPQIQLVVKTNGKPGTYRSQKGGQDVFGTYREAAGSFNSKMHTGSCHVTIQELDAEHVSGTFEMTGYDQGGGKAKSLSGAFRIKIKKE